MRRPLLSMREQADMQQGAQLAIGCELQRRYEPPRTLPGRLADLVRRLAERENCPQQVSANCAERRRLTRAD